MKALGAFWNKPEVIRVVRLRKLDVVAHEVGHYLSKKYDIKLAAKMLTMPERRLVAQELVKMGKDLYGNRKPAGGYAEEGVAQWVRFFVTEPARMAQDAPTFTVYMDKLLDRESALRDSLLKARDNWELYQASSDDAKIGSMVERTLPSQFAGTSPGQLIDYLFNDLKAIRRAVDRIGAPAKMSENAANLAELTKGNAGRVIDMLDNGVIKFNSEGVRVTRGLRQILADVGEKNREEFTNYLIARQVLTKTGQGIDTGFDVEAARNLVGKHITNRVFVKAANEFWDFRNALLEYEADAGLLTKAELQAIRKNNPTPTPFYRSFDEEPAVGGNGRSVQLARNSAGVHKMKGSDRPVIDPLQSIINDAYTMVDRAQKHYAATVLLKSALDLDGGGHIAQLLPEVPKELRRIHMDRVAQQLVDAGWTPPDANDPSGAGVALDYLQAFYEKRQAGAREFRDQVLPILIDGERKWVQINDRSTWEALQGMNVPELGLLERIVSSPTRWLRLGATAANPDFALLNPLRDAFPAAIYSAGPTHLPGYHVVRGAGHMLREAFHYKGGDPLTERFAQEGGESAGMIGADRRTMTRDYQRNVHEMMRSTPRAVLDHLWPPSQWVKSIGESFQIFENATRMGEFVTVREARMKAGMSEREASVEGAYSARNVTQDFQKQGSTIRWLNRYIPFLGAAMGDWYKLGMEFNPRNLETAEGRARYAKVGLRAMAYITVPSVALYLLQHDDEDYQEIPEYLKANAWVVVDKDNGPIPFTLQSGKKVRIWVLPRPYMLGYIFGYMPEKILAGMKEKDPDQFKEILKQSGNILVPPWMPTIAAPFIENARNKSQFSGNPIVPESVQGLEPSEQATPRTGETARLLGKATNQSPAQIENVERGYFGGAGQTVIRGIDALAKRVEQSIGKTPLSPESTSTETDPLDHTPVIGRFIAPQPGANARSVSRLFDDYEAAERKRQTWRSFLKAGKMQLAATYLRNNRDAIASVASEDDTGTEHGGPLREAHKLLTDITTARRQLIGTSGISPEQMAAKIRELGMLERAVAHNYYQSRR
ncbi:MAG TPA: LPD38 domain-containing protein [Gemmatimonadaceae bacterium]|nr:LPD38 domain-containing protein [Gemmatimonadaceae bacterium]